MLITTDQIRAARALLNWSQEELAQRSGLARPTIVNIENSAKLPEMRTMQKIASAFDKADIEFGANESVSRKNEDVKIYRGNEEFKNFFDEVREYATTQGGQIFVGNVDEREWVKAQGNFFEANYARQMTKVKKRLDFRILIKKGDQYMPAASYATYRWVPPEDFAIVPFHVYGDRLSVFLFLDEPIIISLKNQSAADIYREKFLQQWDKAITPKKRKKQ
jgi:transcriptional regulator with XRE-family HTH domain